MNTVDHIRASIVVIIAVTSFPKFSQSYHNFYKILKSDLLSTILISALIHVGQRTGK